MIDDSIVSSLFAHPDWPDGVICIDVNNRVMQLSPRSSSLLGIALDGVRGCHIHDVLCAHIRGYAHESNACPLIQKDLPPLDSVSAYWVCVDGDYIGVDYRLIPLKNESGEFTVISFHPNRDKIYSQAELERFAQYVESSPTPIAEFDTEGQMIFANPAMHNILIEQGFDDNGVSCIQPDHFVSLCEEVCLTNQYRHDVEVIVGDRYFSWHFFPMASATPDAVMGFLFDITDIKLNEQRINREKAEARRDFFAKMVHELRTPLNAIIGFSQILIRRNKALLPERDLDNLKSIRTAGLQLNEMISDTLDISKIEAGKMDLELESFSPADVLNLIYEQMSTLAEAKSLSFTVECDSEISMYSDAKKFRQIVVNLISNAIKYTLKGYVKVKISRSVSTTRIALIDVEVVDSGLGIPEDQLGSLFGAYQQISEQQNRHIEGTGLGLALVSEIVRMLDGEIKVSSEYHQGSCFVVSLPERFVADDRRA